MLPRELKQHIVHVGEQSSLLLLALAPHHTTPYPRYEHRYNHVEWVTPHQDCTWPRKHTTRKLGQAFGALERKTSVKHSSIS